MLVFDFTHDLFNQIFNGDKTINAAIFVNDQGHMQMRQLHL